jgi:FAD-dependent urate hydroxylase
MAVASILVVGGGIAGLATARALAGAGFSVDLVEREGAWTGAGAGIYLPGNAARALRTLGLERAVLERAVVIPRQRFSDHRGRLLAEVDLAEMWDGVGPCLALHRADLHAVLIDGAREVPIRMGVDVREFSEHNGTLSVELGDGTRAIMASWSERTESTAPCAGSRSATKRPPVQWDRWDGVSPPPARPKSRRGR